MADKYGRKRMFFFAIMASGISYFLVGVATSPNMLIVSRVVIGLLKQTTTIASSYVSDITPSEQRTTEIAYTRFVMSMAFIVGPSLGGFLSGFGLSVPAFFAASIFFVEWMIVFSFLMPSEELKRELSKLEKSSKVKEVDFSPEVKEKNQDSVKKEVKEKIIPEEVAGESMWQFFCNNQNILYLLFLHFASNMASLGFNEAFSLYARDALKLSPTLNGYLWTYLSILSTLTQRYGIKILNDLLK